jgi:hypothetical protein
MPCLLMAQAPFRYDTIRTEKKLYHYEHPYEYETKPFTYDTIRYAQPSQPAHRQKKRKHAQQTEQQMFSFDKQKLFFGGNIGLQFGSYTLIDISPQVGYAFSKWFAAGVGATFIYFDYYEYQQTNAGINLFGNIYPTDFIILSMQPGLDRVWYKDHAGEGTSYAPSFLVGAGLYIPMGRGGMSLMLKYDLVQHDYSPYGHSVFYAVGYTFSL